MNKINFIKNIFQSISNFVSNHLRASIIAVVSILITAGGVGAYQYSSHEEIETVPVKIGDITEVVSVTGKVKSAESVDLAFESGGRITYIAGEEGTIIRSGQLLASVSSGDIAADLEQARATLRSEESRLMEIKNGAGAAELSLQQAAVDRAVLQVEESVENLKDAIRESYSLADNAIRSKSYQFFNSPRSYNASLKLYVRYKTDSDEIELLRRESEEALTEWERKMQDEGFYKEADAFKQYLYTMQRFLDKLSIPVNELDDDSGYSQTTIDAYKADTYAARSGISSALSSLSSAITALKTAESNLQIENRTLDLKKSGATEGEVNIQQAVVDRAKANVSRFLAELSKKQIVSPINGVITRLDLKKGEIVSPNQPVIAVMSNAQFEIEVYVPEADIQSISVGDSANVTLDAYASDVSFKANVSKIDIAETVIQGVSAYRAVLQFEDADSRIRSGMTANVEVAANTELAALVVPTRAIFYEDNRDFVKVLMQDGSVREVDVKTGLRNDDGEAQVIADLQEGDLVVMP